MKERETHLPERKEKVLQGSRNPRGKLNDANFDSRMHGQGAYADQLATLHRAACRMAGVGSEIPKLSTKHFRRPHDARGQLALLEAA